MAWYKLKNKWKNIVDMLCINLLKPLIDLKLYNKNSGMFIMTLEIIH